MIAFSNPSTEISMIAILTAILTVKVLSLVAAIWFVVQGFRVHWGWGVANLLVPGAFIPFCIFHPKESRRPLILLGICLGGFLILWIVARNGSHRRPTVAVAPALPASATNAVLHLKLDSFNEASRRGISIYGKLSQNRPVLGGGHSDDGNDEEQLIAIKVDGFVVRFTNRVGGEMRTNCVLFPYGQTTETNIWGWDIVGDYSGKMASSSSIAVEPTGGNAFHLLTTNGISAPTTGRDSPF